MLNDIINAQERVEDLLKNYPELRDNDQLLYLAYLCKYHNIISLLGIDKYKALREIVTEDAPKYESITRARRKIQEKGMYIGLKRLQKLKEEERVRDYFRKKIMSKQNCINMR